MHQFLPFIVIGIATGAVYGLAGLGLVLTYKTSGVFNFGYGALAALVSFLFYFLHTEHRWPWPLAAVVCLVIFAPLLGWALESLTRSLVWASDTIKVLATIGFILLVESLALLWHETNPPTFSHFLPQSTVKLLGVNITWEEIILFLFSLTASALLFWFFRSTRLGVLMRGVVDNHELVSMSGDNPVLVRRWAWVIGTAFAGIAGLFLAASQQVDGTTLTTEVFAAFGAAAIGYFTNLPLTFVGGLAIGVAGSLMDKYSATISWIGGLPPALPFVILFLVLILMPRGRLMQRRLAAALDVRRPYQAPVPLRLVAGLIAIVILAIIPSVQASHLAVWTAGLIDIMLFLSLGLLVKRSGQISLCHLAFAAVGAAAFGHFASSDGLPWLVALLLAMLIAVPVGAVIAIPAVRVSGVFLALATLGFGILAQDVFYTRSFMFTSSTLGIAEPRPAVSIGGWNLSTDKGFYYLMLVFAVLTVLTIIAISNGRLGRLLEALADSPLALETHGTTASVLKVIVFCITAAMASMAGAFTGMLYHFGVGTYFDSFTSVYMFAIVVIITLGDPWYGVVGAVTYAVIPGYLHGATTASVLQLLFGVAAAAAAWGTRMAGAPARVRAFLDRIGGRKPAAVSVAVAGSTPGAPAMAIVAAGDRGANGRAQPAASTGLEVRELMVRFGGVVAVNGVSLTAPMGRITGLVGPNGAGKTTTFNSCSGLNRPSRGRVVLHGADISHASPPRRARRGLGRTFQRTELFNSLTVRQNVALGREASMAGAHPLTQTFSSPKANRLIADRTEEALTLTGTARIAETQVGLLPIGQRRLVELARVLAGPFDVLLLDEPSSGLDAHETAQFGRVLTTVVRQRGCGILLVEHDMNLVREVCDHIYVLDFGQLIFEGTPDEMQASAEVRAAYLGELSTPDASANDGFYSDGSEPESIPQPATRHQ